MAENQDTSNQDSGNASSVESVDWKAHIPADLKDKGYWTPLANADLSTVLKGYGHAQERLGSAVTVPAEGDKDGWGKLYGRLGRPDKAEGYEYNLPSIEGLEWSKDLFAELNTTAHAAGMSKGQVKAIVDWYTGNIQKYVTTGLDKVNTRAAETEVKLKREYADNYDANVAFAKRAGALYFGKDFTDNVFHTMDEAQVRGLVKLGKELAEDGIFGKNPPELQGTVSKQQAIAEIRKIQGDRAHPYWSTTVSPEREAAVHRMAELHAIAYPEE